MREFERHSFYSVVLEAMRGRGCAACRLVAQASHRYLDAILYEAVNTEEFRAKFRAARGFCPRHTRETGTFANALGTTILYREVLADALARWETLAAKGGSIKPPKGRNLSQNPILASGGCEAVVQRCSSSTMLSHCIASSSRLVRRLLARPRAYRAGSGIDSKCPACQIEEGVVTNFVETVYGHIGDAQFVEAYRASEGLCVGHYEALIAKAPSRARRTLVDMEREKMSVLIARLDEFVRKCDYRFASEPKGDEGHAWADAIRKSAGGVEDDV